MIKSYKEPRSSFMSVEKDLSIITDKILQNQRLMKLLYYTDRYVLSPDPEQKKRHPNLTDKQKVELFGKNIKITPKLYVDGSVLTYIIISFDNFTTNATNPQFRDNIVTFDIICHFDQWQLEDFQLRPYRIAAELDSMLNNERLTGIGLFQFLGCNQIILNDEFAGLTLMYSAIHGGEDKNFNEDQRDLLDPREEAQFIQQFNEMFNGKKK
jgi:hypothetical protein